MNPFRGVRGAGVGDEAGAVPEPGDPAPPGAPEVSQAQVLGERGISSIHRARSLQARVTNLLAFGLMSALGVGLLGWYYARTFAAESGAAGNREAAVRQQASGTVRLPPLGPIRPPASVSMSTVSPATASLIARALGAPPAAPPALADPMPVASYPEDPAGYGAVPAPGPGVDPARPTALERKLSGPAFDASPTDASAGAGPSGPPANTGSGQTMGLGSPGPLPGTNTSITGTSASASRLGALLRPTVTRPRSTRRRRRRDPRRC